MPSIILLKLKYIYIKYENRRKINKLLSDHKTKKYRGEYNITCKEKYNFIVYSLLLI